jgi:hypothetical protein
MLKALGNVAPRHLLDTRLNPPGDLRVMNGGLTAETAETAEKKIQSSQRPPRAPASARDAVLRASASLAEAPPARRRLR